MRLLFIALVYSVISLLSAPTQALEVQVFNNVALDDEAIIKIAGVDQDPTLSTSEIKKRLETSGLFSAVQVTRAGDVIKIAVNEKATWFVFPFYSNDSVTNLFGVVGGQSSVFGAHSNILARVQIGKNNREFSFISKDHYIMNGFWFGGLGFEYEDSLHRIFRDRDVAQTTLNEYYGPSFEVGYHLDPYTTAGTVTYIEHHHFEEVDHSLVTGSQLSHRFFIERSNLYSHEGLSRGGLARAYFETTNPAGFFQFTKWGIASQYVVFLRGNFNWITKPKFESGAGLPRYQLFELGGSHLRGFPNQQFRAPIYGSEQNDLLLGAFTFEKLIFRPLIYADWAFIENSGRTGLGSGLQLYLRDVAIPAVQIYAGYGFNPNGLSISASIGTLL